MERPTGTVVLLFTDIEGSTQHWEERPVEMAAALRRHDELVRAAIEAHGGYVFKTVGDAFYATFSRASDGVAAAVDVQRTLACEDWSAIGDLQVRMAVDCGATDERDGDYFGPVVNRVARLLAIGSGGQVLISNTAADLLRGALPDRGDLRDMGHHRLKDLVEPEHVWQLLAPGLLETFPPLRSLDALPNNLPRQLTPLLGRQGVVTEVEALVRSEPLVTLVGTGGVGKTRVALQVGADLLDGSGDGVWFVELAPLSDPGSIAGAIAAAFGLRHQGERPILDTLLAYLKPRRLVLILDNCEHLIEGVAAVVAAILQAAPNVRVLATSRESLRITGERLYRMPSLSVPSEGENVTAESAREYGAIELFVERAAAVNATFRLDDDNAPIVAEICERLDGIALAIELAAARVKILSPRQLARKLDERFHLLTGGSRAALPRQQTMRALIDWSHDLLTDPEKQLFRRLAIFVGGWTLEGAEAVCADESLDALDVLDLLDSLAEKSLVVADVEQSNPRYRMLESTRAFALEKLALSQERAQLERRHAQWIAGVAEREFEASWTISMDERFRTFEPELENVRAAVDGAFARGEIELAAQIASGFHDIWFRRRGEAGLRRWLEESISNIDRIVEPRVVARVWRAKSRLSYGQRAAEASRRALEIGERHDDVVGQIMDLQGVAFGLMQAGDTQTATELGERGVALCRENGFTRTPLYTNALSAAGVAQYEERPETSREFFTEALALADALGDDLQAMVLRANMAELEFRAKNPHAANVLAQDALATARRFRDVAMEVNALHNLAAYALALGDIEGALGVAKESLHRSRGAFPLYAAMAIQHAAAVAALGNDPHRGARLRGYVNHRYDAEGVEREPTEAHTYELLMAALSERLTPTEIETLAAEGAQFSEEQATAQALQVTA